jgi:hypothetical protein
MSAQSTVSDLCKQLDPLVSDWNARPLQDKRVPLRHRGCDSAERTGRGRCACPWYSPHHTLCTSRQARPAPAESRRPVRCHFARTAVALTHQVGKHPSMPAHGHAQREVVRMSKPNRLINEKLPYFLRSIRQGEAEEQADFPLQRLTCH